MRSYQCPWKGPFVDVHDPLSYDGIWVNSNDIHTHTKVLQVEHASPAVIDRGMKMMYIRDSVHRSAFLILYLSHDSSLSLHTNTKHSILHSGWCCTIQLPLEESFAYTYRRDPRSPEQVFSARISPAQEACRQRVIYHGSDFGVLGSQELRVYHMSPSIRLVDPNWFVDTLYNSGPRRP
jgi:hypothetical protein